MKSEWERLIERFIREGILKSDKVIRAMRLVSRDKFLPENLRGYAAVDTPLRIG
ncbi:protein-L-isoaspartate O-methyltransferase, partial [Candidatus Bathyarchaeota archaeon]